MAAKMLPRKLNIEQHEPLAPLPRKQNKQKTGVNVVAPEGKSSTCSNSDTRRVNNPVINHE
jgi:hypothetical protein